MDGMTAVRELNGLAAFGRWVHGVFVASTVVVVDLERLEDWLIAHPEEVSELWNDMMDEESARNVLQDVTQ